MKIKQWQKLPHILQSIQVCCCSPSFFESLNVFCGSFFTPFCPRLSGTILFHFIHLWMCRLPHRNDYDFFVSFIPSNSTRESSMGARESFKPHFFFFGNWVCFFIFQRLHNLADVISSHDFCCCQILFCEIFLDLRH